MGMPHAVYSLAHAYVSHIKEANRFLDGSGVTGV